MFYENYLKSLRGNISSVSKAVRGGVVLTRLEEFDYLFKKELLIVEGIRNKRPVLNKVIRNITSSDYRLAHFYAEAFSSIINTIRDGYSVKGIEKQFKYFTKQATSKYICSVNLKVNVKDLNGKITVSFSTKTNNEDYVISNMQEYIRVAFCLVSTLGSLDETDNGFREWFHSYLSNELVKVDKGYNAEPFIERDRIAKDLKSYINSDKKNRSFKSSDSKIIYLAK